MVDVFEACVSNVDSRGRTELSRVDATTNVYPCLERCGYCYRQPFLVVDGELVTGRTHTEMIERCTDG